MDVTTTCRDIGELTPNAQIACNMFLEKCKEQGLNILLTETYRSAERQQYLYQQGRTRAGKILTWTLNSRHMSRRAWDICCNIKGHEYDDSSFFYKCGEVAKSLGITWGGTWDTPDTPHFEIPENWQPPKVEEVAKEDKDLASAISKIIKSGIQLEFNSWKRLDLMKKDNVKYLLPKLARINYEQWTPQVYNVAVNELIQEGVISEESKDIWYGHTYKLDYVRSLLIKFASKLY